MIDFALPAFTNPFAVTLWLFTHGGFALVIFVLAYGLWWVYMDNIQTAYATKQQYVVLAIDVPRENEQTPKAVEHIFSHFHGIQKTPNWKEKYIDGYVQPTISLELISIGGFVQYLLRAPIEARDLVEAAIYAQYPNAEIAQVEDYTEDYKPVFPNDEYNMWAAEMILVNKNPYPIRTYPEWEHSLTQTFLDPMASLLEIMTRLQDGEQIWLQWVLEPTRGDIFRQQGIEIINKLIGAKTKPRPGALNQLISAPADIAVGTFQTLTRTLFEPSEADRKRDDGPPNQLLYAPPYVRSVVEAIGLKIAKISFNVKFRFVYLGRPDLFTKSRISGVVGAIKQFNTMNMNGFKPSKSQKTARDYFFVEPRVNAIKRSLLRSYKFRSIWRGGRPIVLNTEELASLWHFPVITVKAPSVKKTDAKRGEPPTTLPVGPEIEYVPKVQPDEGPIDTTPVGSTPSGLPVQPSSPS